MQTPPAWLLTRAYIRQWLSVPAGEHVMSVTVAIQRTGQVPITATAVCDIESAERQYGALALVSSEAFGLANPRPVAYGRRLAVTGPGWFVVTVSTEGNMPCDLWPDDIRNPFAVQLSPKVGIDG
jgi:hypothetical protein